MSQLFYYTPSDGDWNKALPIGNGKLGAMILARSTKNIFSLTKIPFGLEQRETETMQMPENIWIESVN